MTATAPSVLFESVSPAADQLAAEQLVARVYSGGDKPNPEIFAATLAKMSVGDRPLRMFSEAAGWKMSAASRPTRRRRSRTSARSPGDFKYRWGLDPFDPVLNSESDYRKLVAGNPTMRLATVVYRLYPQMFNLRKDLRVELEGTRQALAMYAYFLKNGTFPSVLSGLRPTFIPDPGQRPVRPAGEELSVLRPHPRPGERAKGPRDDGVRRQDSQALPGQTRRERVCDLLRRARRRSWLGQGRHRPARPTSSPPATLSSGPRTSRCSAST